MSGMPLFHALLLLASVIIIVVAARPGRLHPFLAILVVATAFGLAAGFSSSLVAKTFGNGFSRAIYSPGLVIVGAGFVAGLAQSTTAVEWLSQIGRRRWFGLTRTTALLGFIGGIAASPSSAFALLSPLLRAIGSSAGPKREAAMIAPALALSAGHGLVVLSPVPIAAASILGAPWSRVALFGLPLALLLAAGGAAWARWLSPTAFVPAGPIDEPPAILEKSGRWSAIVLLAATAVPLLMLVMQSLGDIPSEPLGGGPRREMVLALGRPLVLFLVAVGIMIIGLWRASNKLLSDAAWTTRVIGNVASVLLIVGAAGGLQSVCQETGMAELIGERLLTSHVAAFAGVLLPFLLAAVLKTLQGSSLVAAIAAAGMVQPFLAPPGLAGANETALAALAVGAGAMTMSHVNDEYFWLVGASARLAPARALALITGGTLLQGLVAAVVLVALAALFV
jgi:gluconate:H+ symporter, GntP family